MGGGGVTGREIQSDREKNSVEREEVTGREIQHDREINIVEKGGGGNGQRDTA